MPTTRKDAGNRQIDPSAFEGDTSFGEGSKDRLESIYQKRVLYLNLGNIHLLGSAIDWNKECIGCEEKRATSPLYGQREINYFFSCCIRDGGLPGEINCHLSCRAVDCLAGDLRTAS